MPYRFARKNPGFGRSGTFATAKDLHLLCELDMASRSVAECCAATTQAENIISPILIYSRKVLSYSSRHGPAALPLTLVQALFVGKYPSTGLDFDRGAARMPSEIFNHSASVMAMALLISIVTGGAAIAAGGIGHAVASRAFAPCAFGGCAFAAHQAKPAHVAKASAWIALRRH